MMYEWYTVKTVCGSYKAAIRYATELSEIGSQNPTIDELKELNII